MSRIPDDPGAVVARLLACTLAAVGAAGCGNSLPIRAVDYRLPPAVLAPVSAAGVTDATGEFGALFCSVLEHVDELADVWGPCERYLETTAGATVELGEIPDDYRVLVISGVLSECVSETLTAFSEARRHLDREHGMTVEYIDVPAYGSSAYNGRVIADHIKRQRAQDPRRYLVVGFSKGVPDTLEGIVADAEAREGVAGLITVSGAIGGSRLADLIEDQMGELISRLSEDDCDRGDDGAFRSLRRSVRQEFLASQQWPVVPSYSIVGIAGPETTSKINQPTFEYLSRFALEQDGQVIAWESIVPGGTFLGAAKADHWGIAMPFDRVDDPWVREFIDRSRYPRTALLEAAVRFAIDDLGEEA